MVVQGRKNTLGVSLDHMIYHSHCVSKALRQSPPGLRHALHELPASIDEAVKNCGKVLKQGQAEAVKLEGGEEIAPTVKRLTDLGIPVMGHVGLKPMHVHLMGGYKIQGRDTKSEKRILKDAKALEKSGAYSIVLEGIPADLAQKVSRSLKIPTIGIGSGPHCDGQVLVIYDLLGMYQEIQPKFVRRYSNLFETITESVKRYISDVQSGNFPSEKESF
jgi:3-methyl-2-oxobutanoate hydroxymethyltransferase